MKTRYIFKFVYARENHKAKAKKVEGFAGELKPQIEFTEMIVAENINQALEHWKLDLMDEGVEFKYIVKEGPVLAVLQ